MNASKSRAVGAGSVPQSRGHIDFPEPSAKTDAFERYGSKNRGHAEAPG